LQPFALALIIGVLIGTYSSLFIASPIMYLLDDKYNIDTEEE
jgi:preprotein translocase subunit SecF